MLLTKLKINFFGRFHNREIELKPGINLIYGDNEAGKSTIHTFIKGMLFGIERLRGRASASKEDLYTRYLPWDYPGAFGGSMDIRIGDKEYRLQRSFHASDKYFTVLDLSTGREVKLKEGLISEMIPGLTESAFKNTISIEQLKAQTDGELASQVRNYIANLSLAKSQEVNVAKAISTLTEQRKQLEPSQNPATLKALQAQIEEELATEEKIDQLTLELKDLLQKEQELKQIKDEASASPESDITKRMEQLPAIMENYRSYKEIIKQENILEQQTKELDEKILRGDQEQLSTNDLREDIKEVGRLKSRLMELEQKASELVREKTELSSKANKNMLLSLLPSFALAAILLFAFRYQSLGIALSIVSVVIGLAAYCLLRSRSRKERSQSEAKCKEHEQQKAMVRAAFSDILNRYRVSGLEELYSRQEELIKNQSALIHAKEQKQELEARRKVQEDSRDVLYETIMKYMQYFITEDELTDTSMQRLQEEIQRRRQEAAIRISESTRLYDGCRLATQKLRWEITNLEGNEEQLLKHKDRYKELEQKQKEDAAQLDAIKLALSSIQELSADIHDSFGNQINAAVSEIISEVTSQKYSDLKVDEKLEVKVGWNGDYVLLERLSAGTIDQVYFALRLAVADLLLGSDEMPLLLDDSFALYDEGRVRAALTKIAGRSQILLFTCHKREEKLLKELGLSYHLVDLSQM